jgi:molybdopterin-guanine dinucleotide biosynthesis protein A
MKGACSGVILAGGLSMRMDGKNKAFLEVDGAPILERLYGTFKTFFQELLLVTNSPREYLSWDLAIVSDLFPVRCSLTGIHSGLFHARTSFAFVAACDMPFLRAEVIEILLRHAEPKWDVIIPVTGKGYEPLCAVYSKRCIKPIERQLKRGKGKIADFFPHVRIKEVPEAELLKADPDLVSFFNINRPEDLARLEPPAGKPLGKEH